jgi:hypothetical protein
MRHLTICLVFLLSVYLSHAQNVGINQPSPIYNMHVTDASGNGVAILGESANSSNASIYVHSLGVNANAGFGYMRSSVLRGYSGINFSNDWFLNVGPGSNNLYVANATGNVGINTNAPNQQFHILGIANVDAKAKIEGVGTGSSAGFQAKGNGGSFDIFEMTKYNTLSGGSVAGVPLANLSLLYTGANAGRMLLDIITSNPMQFATANSVRMTIAGDGNIGMGTSTPTRQLDVNGTARLGVNGTTISNVIKVSVVVDIPFVATGAFVNVPVSISNAAVGSVVYISPLNDLNGLVIASARVSSPGTVQIVVVNALGSGIDPPPTNMSVLVVE